MCVAGGGVVMEREGGMGGLKPVLLARNHNINFDIAPNYKHIFTVTNIVILRNYIMPNASPLHQTNFTLKCTNNCFEDFDILLKRKYHL